MSVPGPNDEIIYFLSERIKITPAKIVPKPMPQSSEAKNGGAKPHERRVPITPIQTVESNQEKTR